MKKLIIIFVLLCVCTVAAFSQNGNTNLQTEGEIPAQKSPFELSVFGGGGYSFIGFLNPLNKTASKGYNYDVGLGFTGFVSPQCGFHLGIGFAQNKVTVEAGDVKSVNSGLYDSNEHFYNLHTTLYDYSEIQNTKSLFFPVMFLFQSKENSGTAQFYVMTGVKVHVQLSRAYDTQITALSNAAYYPEADNWAATQLFANLGEFSGSGANGKLDVGVMAMFTFEMGAKFRIGNLFNLYTGAYFDCGLNDPSKSLRKSAGNYTTVESLSNLSLLEVYKNSFLMGVGIKLRFAFRPPVSNK